MELNNLAALYSARGRYEEAEPLFRRALAVNEKSLGADHPRVAMTLENYARLLKGAKRKREATALQRRAEEIWNGRDEHRDALVDLELLRASRPRRSRSIVDP
jgi:tetratricopeptide (TPR) repeat protein